MKAQEKDLQKVITDEIGQVLLRHLGDDYKSIYPEMSTFLYRKGWRVVDTKNFWHYGDTSRYICGELMKVLLGKEYYKIPDMLKKYKGIMLEIVDIFRKHTYREKHY